jgi:ankyrin repeat protein/catechol 2,3-dioxygenase-like lactoylglutathione lyase family enzyme
VNPALPARPSLEYLPKLAKDRLRTLRETQPDSKLTQAQLEIARAHGFPSWRALKAEVDRQAVGSVSSFFNACATGDLEVVSSLVAAQPDLVRAADPSVAFAGWTGLHTAARRGQTAVVRFLLGHGADPQAREAGDATTPLHWAAAEGNLEIVQALLAAGTDATGAGDDHELEVIGWATYFDHGGPGNPEVVAELLAHGARHHIISAVCTGDHTLIRSVVGSDPAALQRRMSRFEQRRTALHLAIVRRRPDILALLIELGADLNAEDAQGHSPLTMAMMRGDTDATQVLAAAGAESSKGWKLPKGAVRRRQTLAPLAPTIQGLTPMLGVPDVGATLDWYTRLGFQELERFANEGTVDFAVVGLGKARLFLTKRDSPHVQDLTLWFQTDRVNALYDVLKARQLESVQAGLAGDSSVEGIDFVQDLSEPFYGGREFGIRDPNGYTLFFRQPVIP